MGIKQICEQGSTDIFEYPELFWGKAKDGVWFVEKIKLTLRES